MRVTIPGSRPQIHNQFNPASSKMGIASSNMALEQDNSMELSEAFGKQMKLIVLPCC